MHSTTQNDMPSVGADQPVPHVKSLTEAALPRALFSVLLIIGGYFALAYSVKPFLDGVMIAGYTIDWSVWVSAVLSVGVIAWVKATRGDLSTLGISRPKSIWKAVVTGVASVAGTFAFVALVLTALSMVGITAPEVQSGSAVLVKGPSVAITLIFSMLFMWINAAIGEELLFRGYLQNNLNMALGNGWRGGVASAFIIAVIFGLLHVPSQGLYGFAVTGSAGFALGIAFLIGKRNLLPVVIAHGLINSVSMLSEISAG